jgi:putative transposase
MSDQKKQRLSLELPSQVSDDGKKRAKSRQSKPRQDIDGYSIKEIEQAAGLPRSITTVCYARVSSHSQRDDLKRQIELLRSRFPEAEIISEIGSGLNFKRKRFLAPFWTEFSQVISSALSLPIQTDSSDSDLNWLNGYANDMSANSWFSMTTSLVPNKNSFKICCPSSTASVRGLTDCEDTKKKSKKKYGKNPYKKSKKVQPNSVLKVPVWPSLELHKIWKQWLAAYRWVYNQCIEFFNQQETLPKSRSLDQVIQSRQSQPENKWTKCLGKTRQEAVCEAEQAYKQARAANNDQTFNCVIALVEINPK